jgi:hypothetical protein
MKNHIRSIAIVLLVTTLLPISTYAEEKKNSGFLGDYSKLTQEKDSTGETVLRYVNPALKPGDYTSVIIDFVQLYPEPKATEQVSEQTLNDIRNYVDGVLQDKIADKMFVTTEPGPGVLLLRPAITAVASQKAGLKPYELLPIGFLISSAAGRDKVAAITMEFDVLDSVSGERVAASVRKGAGAKLEGDKAQLTLEHLRPTLDKWIETGSSFMAEKFK